MQVKKENFSKIQQKNTFKQALSYILGVIVNKYIGGWSVLLSKNVYTASKLPAHCGDRSQKSQVSLFLGVITCQVYFFYYLYKATVSHTRVT